MVGVNGGTLVSAADDCENRRDTSAPAESDILSMKKLETNTKDTNREETPNLSTKTSSATLTVQEEETATKVPEGDPIGPAIVEAQSDHSNSASKQIGWPTRSPFSSKTLLDKNGVRVKEKEDLVFWADLTWKQKNAWRRAFLTEYLSETKRCLPFVWRLYGIIYRLSPWRAVVLLGVSIFRGFLPALTLQTRGNFIMMVTY